MYHDMTEPCNDGRACGGQEYAPHGGACDACEAQRLADESPVCMGCGEPAIYAMDGVSCCWDMSPGICDACGTDKWIHVHYFEQTSGEEVEAALCLTCYNPWR